MPYKSNRLWDQDQPDHLGQLIAMNAKPDKKAERWNKMLDTFSDNGMEIAQKIVDDKLKRGTFDYEQGTTPEQRAADVDTARQRAETKFGWDATNQKKEEEEYAFTRLTRLEDVAAQRLEQDFYRNPNLYDDPEYGQKQAEKYAREMGLTATSLGRIMARMSPFFKFRAEQKIKNADDVALEMLKQKGDMDKVNVMYGPNSPYAIRANNAGAGSSLKMNEEDSLAVKSAMDTRKSLVVEKAKLQAAEMDTGAIDKLIQDQERIVNGITAKYRLQTSGGDEIDLDDDDTYFDVLLSGGSSEEPPPKKKTKSKKEPEPEPKLESKPAPAPVPTTPPTNLNSLSLGTISQTNQGNPIDTLKSGVNKAGAVFTGAMKSLDEASTKAKRDNTIAMIKHNLKRGKSPEVIAKSLGYIGTQDEIMKLIYDVQDSIVK